MTEKQARQIAGSLLVPGSCHEAKACDVASGDFCILMFWLARNMGCVEVSVAPAADPVDGSRPMFLLRIGEGGGAEMSFCPGCGQSLMCSKAT